MTTVFIVSAPSGSGKSTLVNLMLERDRNLLFSVSYTTRAPRGAEVDGIDYHYIQREEFETRVANSEFLEHAEVFGNYYGTHRGILDKAVAEGKDLVLDIDVQGARQLRKKIPDAVSTASIFILAPSREIRDKRLRSRSEAEPKVRNQTAPGFDADLPDLGRARGADEIVHLHGVENGDPLAALDHVTRLDEDLEYHTRHGRAQRPASGTRGGRVGREAPGRGR